MARSFNGSSDFVDCGAHINPTAISIACWVNFSSLTNATSAAYNAVVSRNNPGGGANLAWQLFVKSNGKLAVYLQASVALDYDGTGSHTLSTNTWTNIGFSYDSGNGIVGYVNGASDATVAANGALATIGSTLSLTFSKDTGTANRFVQGSMADVGIWNTNLTAGEWSALGKSALPKDIRPGSLLGYWPLDGLQSPEPDLSGNGFNGTLTGTALAAGPPVVQFTPRWHRFLGWTPMLPASGLGWIINRRNKLMVPKKRA